MLRMEDKKEEAAALKTVNSRRQSQWKLGEELCGADQEAAPDFTTTLQCNCSCTNVHGMGVLLSFQLQKKIYSVYLPSFPKREDIHI